MPLSAITRHRGRRIPATLATVRSAVGVAKAGIKAARKANEWFKAYRTRRAARKSYDNAPANKKARTSGRSTNRDMGAGAELTRMSLSWGKPKRAVSKGNKLEQASIQRTTLRWEAVVPYNNITQPVIGYVGGQPTAGHAMYLPNFSTVNSGAGQVYAPLHLYDLTSTINDTSQGLLEAIPGYQLAFNYAGGLLTAPKWFPLNGTDYAGNLVTLAPWRVEQSPGNLSQNSSVYPGARCLMPWA